MKRLTCIVFMLLFFSMLVACTQSTQTTTPSVEIIGPGDKIGDILVVQGPYPPTYPMIWEYCEFLFDGTEPVNLSSECTVPKVPGLALSFGWLADEALFESSWNAVTY
jgi:hypothetical protein